MRISAAAAILAASTVALVGAQTSTYVFNTATTDAVISTDTTSTPYSSSASNSASSTYSVPFYNVSSIPASASTQALTASSNFTLPTPTASATFPANFVMQKSNPFVYTDVDTANLPKIYYSLLNETTQQRQLICNEQTKFCSTAGCEKEGATIKDNFCNVNTMAVMCKCDKGSSNLQQWKWPVQFQDCLRRGNTCTNACALPGGTTQARNACKSACQSSFSGTCGFPNQYSANYAVSKEGQKPSLKMTQGGTAGNGAFSLRSGAYVVVFFAIGTSLILV